MEIHISGPLDTCKGDTITLTASATGGTAPYTFSWIRGQYLYPSGTTHSVPANKTHTLKVTTTNSEGCMANSTFTVTHHPVPTLTCALTDSSLCQGESLSLQQQCNLSGTWSGTGVQQQTFDATGLAGGTYPLLFTHQDSFGCVWEDSSQAVTVHKNPIVTASSLPPLCVKEADTALLSLGQPADGTWSGKGVINGTFFSPAQAGEHELVYSFQTQAGCTGSDTATFEVVGETPIHITPIASLCFDSRPVALQATPTGGLWSGTGIQNGTFDPVVAGPGTHALYYRFDSICTSRDSTFITVHPEPEVDAGTDSSFCLSDPPLVLQGAPSGGTWSGTGITAGQFDPATADTGTFTLTYAYTDIHGCSSQDERVFSVFPVPALMITYTRDNFSNVDYSFSVTNPTPLAEVRWDFGDGTTATGETSVEHTYPNENMTYNVWVWGINAEGCEDSAMVTVDVQRVGLSPTPTRSLTIYPNPAREFVVVEWQQSPTGEETLQVLDVAGRYVQVEVVQLDSGWRINTEALPGGYYQVVLRTSEGSVHVGKVMVR